MELVIDIETVSGKRHFKELSAAMQAHWQHKASFFKNSTDTITPEQSYTDKAAIYAEFGKIICIGLGFIDKEGKQVRIKTLSDREEQKLLVDFCVLLERLAQEHEGNILFCGHNIREFDLPYICRRILVNGLALPETLRLSGLKPWQVPHTDTLELWKFGDYKHYISLDLMAELLNIPSSKTDIDGSEVSRVYWEEDNLQRIADYCSRDIFTTALVYLRLSAQPVKGFEPVFVT
ncbi:MAG: 3'-5' exonuclease [Sphingobacteriales bacterium]|nr:MAG: 3'-5' exonuclease [Sphingobacteriales bacterium]